MEIKGLKIDTVWNDEIEGHLFVVTHNDKVVAEELSNCRYPEDATTFRAFKWVEPLLNKVYALGKQDGYLEGLRDGAK